MLSNCKLPVKLYKISCLSLGNLAKMLFCSILSFKNWSFANYSAFGASHFRVSSLMTENLRGLRENLCHKIRSIGFPKTLPQEEVKSNIFENEFATSMIEQYIVVRAKQLLVPMLIYHFWRHWRQVQWIFLKANNHQDLVLLVAQHNQRTIR